MFAKILGACAHAIAGASQFRGDDVDAYKWAKADGEVDMLCDQVDIAVRKLQIEIDLGIAFQKCRHMRHDADLPESHRGAEAELTLRFGAIGANVLASLIQLCEDRLNPGGKMAAGLR